MKHSITRISTVLLVLVLIFALVPGCKNVDKVKEATATIKDASEAIKDTLSEIDIPSVSDISSAISAGIPSSDSSAQSSDSGATQADASHEETPSSNARLNENGTYTTKDDVALYIHTYGKLPNNFITKKQAQAKGWNGGSLEPYAPGFCIGGDHFGNYEGLLPEKNGRSYTECDIDTLGASSRGAKRIIFSNDGLIYYTDDHYESFTLLYGEE